MALLFVPVLASVLAAAAPVAAPGEPRAAPAAQATVRATAEIVRAETSSPDAGEGGARRQVRPRDGGQIAVEFE